MEHELKALKTEFAEYKAKQEADIKTEIDSLKELIRDLWGDIGEIMSMHDEQEEDLNSCLDRHRFDITLGASGYLPSRPMVSSLWVLKQFAHPLPTRPMVGIF